MSVPLGFLFGLLNIKVEPPPEMRSHSLYIRYMHLQVDHIVHSLISYECLVVVQEPLMPEDKLELVRSQLLGAIARRGDDVHSPCFLFLCIHGFVLIGLFVMNGACTGQTITYLLTGAFGLNAGRKHCWKRVSKIAIWNRECICTST
jgi:hypothetical protein